MMERQNDFFYVFFIAKKKTYSLFKSGEEIPGGILRSSKDVFYLNDFYDLLYEKMESTTSYGGIAPQYFQSEKYYTMGPGIDFPLVMNYISEEQQSSSGEAYLPFTLHASRSTTSYFYFLNGHGDVTYFADANFTLEEIETYEYSPWGVLLTSASKNNLLYTSAYYDPETGMLYYFGTLYNPEIKITINKSAKKYGYLIRRLHRKSVAQRSTGDGIHIAQGWWNCYDVEYSWPCFDDEGGNEDESGGGGGEPEDDPECSNPTLYTVCTEVCASIASCKSCCSKVNILYKNACKLLPLIARALCYIECGWKYGTCKVDCSLSY